VDDPQLVKLTVTIGGGHAGTLSFDIFQSGGEVKLWKDKRKQAAFTSEAIAAGVNPKEITLYVEGVHESKDGKDVLVQAKFTPTTAPQAFVTGVDILDVAPLIVSFTKSIPDPSVRFRNFGPPANGLAGLEAAKTTEGGGFIPGIEFTADVIEGSLRTHYLQNINVENRANGSTGGAVFVAGSGLANKDLLPKPDSLLTYPALDAFDANDPTAWGSAESYTANPPGGAIMKFRDSPRTGQPANSDKLDVMDLKYSYRTYLVIKYPDSSIYPIASWDWDVNFHATTNVPGSGVSVIAPGSKVSAAAAWVRSNDDPLKTAGPIFNGNTHWR
jgi:hypothetical protein